MRVLVVNAGSSTLKLSLLDGERRLAHRTIETGGADVEAALSSTLEELETPDAVGHRVVHGGGVFSAATRIDDQVRARLGAFVELAPLHQPPALEGIDLVGRLLPDVPAVACFDTAFHSTLPPAASTYALPERWRTEFGLRRFGFHGLSHAYAAYRAAELLGRSDARIVICHLGAGASLAAVRGQTCVDTTMGFTPLEGLVMATRSGDLDPGIVPWLLRNTDLDVDTVEDELQHRSGLAGLAGTPDMREVLDRSARGDRRARLGLDVYVHRLRKGIAAMAASLDGLDALVFTGGVGENAPFVREKTVAGLGFLGLTLDAERNAADPPDAELTAPGGTVRCLVIAAREDLRIAEETRRVLDGS